LITPQHVPELHELRERDDGTLQLGGAADLTRLWQWLETRRPSEAVRAIIDQLFWFSGTSIRSGACLAGNIVTASPISDLNPVWLALDARFVLESAARGRRSVPANEFFIGYRKTALADDELLIGVEVPPLPRGALVRSYKQAQRREDDIAIVTACYRVDRDDAGVVTCARFALGGVAPLTLSVILSRCCCRRRRCG
jgi:xanthine dehydrogenase/oxidase